MGQLAGSLEELELGTQFFTFDEAYRDWDGDPDVDEMDMGLPSFPESFCALTELRRFVLYGHSQIKTIPDTISSLKKLKELTLGCHLSSLPKELGELSGLKNLMLFGKRYLGNAVFPAELGNLKSLRHLDLAHCGLHAVPAFVGELESLEYLDLSFNDALEIRAPLDFLIEGCPFLGEVRLNKRNIYVSYSSASWVHLEAFIARLRAWNPNAIVVFR